MTPTAAAMIRLSLVKGVGPARMRKVLKLARAARADLSPFLENADNNLAEVLSHEQIEILRDNQAACDELVHSLRSSNIGACCIADVTYPPQLLKNLGEDHAPPLLLTRGNAEMLGAPGVGFCGSRHASDRGLRVAEDCAEQLAAAGIVVTSGYAAGVDLRAHAAALRSGGRTIVVLAEGITHFRVKAEVENVWSWDRACVVSEFSPQMSWSAGNAMQRNRSIVGLSRAMILIEAGATGGSIAAGRDALAAGVPLFAAEYEGMPEGAVGNRQLIQKGAHRLMRNRHTMKASLDVVLGTVRTANTAKSPAQLRLPS